MMLLYESKTFLLIIRGIRLTQKVIGVTWTVYGAAQKSSFETIDSMGLFLAKGSYDGRSLAEQFPTLWLPTDPLRSFPMPWPQKHNNKFFKILKFFETLLALLSYLEVSL